MNTTEGDSSIGQRSVKWPAWEDLRQKDSHQLLLTIIGPRLRHLLDRMHCLLDHGKREGRIIHKSGERYAPSPQPLRDFFPQTEKKTKQKALGLSGGAENAPPARKRLCLKAKGRKKRRPGRGRRGEPAKESWPGKDVKEIMRAMEKELGPGFFLLRRRSREVRASRRNEERNRAVVIGGEPCSRKKVRRQKTT